MRAVLPRESGVFGSAPLLSKVVMAGTLRCRAATASGVSSWSSPTCRIVSGDIPMANSRAIKVGREEVCVRPGPQTPSNDG